MQVAASSHAAKLSILPTPQQNPQHLRGLRAMACISHATSAAEPESVEWTLLALTLRIKIVI